MGTLISEDPAPINTAERVAGYSNLSTGVGAEAASRQAWYNNPMSAGIRATNLRDAEKGQQISRWGGFREPNSALLEPDDANERYGIPGEITFKTPVRENAAKLTREWAIERKQYEDSLSRARSGFLPATGRFAAQLLASAADPLNIASGFIPVVGEARFFKLAATLGKPLARVVTGAAEGAVGAAVIEPMIYTQAQREQADYDGYDSLLNLSLGAGLGSIAHVGLGAAGDWLRAAPKVKNQAKHQAALAGAMAALEEGRPVTVASLIDAVGRIQAAAAGPEKSSGLSPAERSTSGVATGAEANRSAAPDGTQALEAGSQAANTNLPGAEPGLKASTEPSQTLGTEVGRIDLSSSPKVYQAVNDVNSLVSAAKEGEAGARDWLEPMVDGIEGAHFTGVRAKKLPAIESKIAIGKRPDQISDYLGARIVVDTVEAMRQVIERLKATGQVLEVDDFMAEGKNGYRAVHLQMAAPDGKHSFELQIQPGAIAAVRKEAHAIYAKWRRKPTSEFTTDDLARMDSDMNQMRGILDGAWAKWLDQNQGVRETAALSTGSENVSRGEASAPSPGLQQVRPAEQAGAGAAVLPFVPRGQDAAAAGEGPRGVVITAKGRRVPVTYQVVEASSLTTSHGDDLAANPAFPADLQPRDRGRAASAGQVAKIANSPIPEWLGRSNTTTSGAPITGPDGVVVESGNGRVIGLRRMYRDNPAGAAEYRAYLESEGFKTEGMKEPVLIRRRTAELDPRERQAFAREANEDSTLAMSAPEQAMADAATMGPGLIERLKPGPVTSEANREFLRSFIAMLPQSEQGALLGGRGEISQQGIARVQAALLAKAYGDPDLLARMVEATDDNMKTVGKVLTEIAPLWIKLRDAAADGRIPAEMDATPAMMQAIELIRRARDQGHKVGDLARQVDMFDPEAEKLQLFLQMMYGPNLNRAIGHDKLLSALTNYAEQALQNTTDARLLGDPLSARQLMGGVVEAENVDPRQAMNQAIEEQRASHEIQPEEKATIAQVDALAKDVAVPETLEAAQKEAAAMDEEMTALLDAARAGGLLTAGDEAALTSAADDAKLAKQRAKGIEALGACLVGNT